MSEFREYSIQADLALAAYANLVTTGANQGYRTKTHDFSMT